MCREAQAPINSRWQDLKGHVWKVIDRKPFGKLDLMREDRAVFSEMKLRDLLANLTPLID